MVFTLCLSFYCFIAQFSVFFFFILSVLLFNEQGCNCVALNEIRMLKKALKTKLDWIGHQLSISSGINPIRRTAEDESLNATHPEEPGSPVKGQTTDEWDEQDETREEERTWFFQKGRSSRFKSLGSSSASIPTLQLFQTPEVIVQAQSIVPEGRTPRLDFRSEMLTERSILSAPAG